MASRYLQINRLRIMRRGHTAYDQNFHPGVNIIRGENGSGKSTISDFIFFILGGEFDDWKDAASQCDEVQAEIETSNGKLVLKRATSSAQQPVAVFFGGFEDASKSVLDRWEIFPLRRSGNKESFSQVMFRTLGIPEAQSDGASNITMHQLLRLCYSDQRTPAMRIFRYESFDTQSIREAVGDLICGISGYELYEIGLEIRDKEKEFSKIDAKLSSLLGALKLENALANPASINAKLRELAAEKTRLHDEIENVDRHIDTGEVGNFLAERKAARARLSKQREAITSLEGDISEIEFELREIAQFQTFLEEQQFKLAAAQLSFDVVGAIAFSHCPACGKEIVTPDVEDHCYVCKESLDPDIEKARYNQIRLDLEIQTRETNQLLSQKNGSLTEKLSEIRKMRSQHKRDLTQYQVKYSGPNGPREAFLAERTNRIGHIDAEEAYLLSTLKVAEEIEALSASKASVQKDLDIKNARAAALRTTAGKRRTVALSSVSQIAAAILRSDLPRQDEFISAKDVSLNFKNDANSVDGTYNFAESSNVFLKNATIFSLFLAAMKDDAFYHPRFLLFDNIEDKGMQEERSHLFQKLIVEHATAFEAPFQIIFTTSMMNPALELQDYVVGPAYTHENRSLDLGIPETKA
ncbi:AAA family ATPase [Thioclava sp. GXIMD4215]|uniref:AAA family ATPase n=1 Tax=Thioclava sp. GXIMD4215 TaxID=3131928 RepID=UPI0032463DF6